MILDTQKQEENNNHHPRKNTASTGVYVCVVCGSHSLQTVGCINIAFFQHQMYFKCSFASLCTLWDWPSKHLSASSGCVTAEMSHTLLWMFQHSCKHSIVLPTFIFWWKWKDGKKDTLKFGITNSPPQVLWDGEEEQKRKNKRSSKEHNSYSQCTQLSAPVELIDWGRSLHCHWWWRRSLNDCYQPKFCN